MPSPQISRRRFLAQGSAWGVAGALGSSVLGYTTLGCSNAQAQAESTESTGAQLVTPEAQSAIDRGLAHLANQQQRNGSIGSSQFAKNPAISSLSGMAFMSSGSTPDRGPYGENVAQCIEYVLSRVQDSGFITAPGPPQHGRMYGHGFATLFLSEMYGMSGDPELGEKLNRAVRLIIDSQNSYGAWRYEPNSKDEDLSVTVCQIMALRSARNAGIHVPHKTIERSIKYVKKCQNPDGGFIYELEHGGYSAFPRSAAGVVALYSAGIYNGPELTNGLKYLMRFLPNGDSSRAESHYFYGHYYAVQAMWHAGGDYWTRWYPAIRDEMLRRQRGDIWLDPLTKNNVYGTAMAAIVLQMPNNYLPIFQR